jgi:hypothetical protein
MEDSLVMARNYIMPVDLIGERIFDQEIFGP